ncbi:MAG: glycosyltransferase family 4 protein [Chlorobi bacterium]|nr:glycosyltransferase family 4 protein [Chlorobiota bacterium]
MIIAINTRLLLKNKLEGIGWFSYETLKRITTQHPEHSFVFIFDRPYDQSFIFSPNVKPVVLFPQTRHPFLWLIWFELRIKKLLKKIKADLFFSPDGYLSLRSNVMSIAAIHDINFVHRPQDLPFLTRVYYNFFFPLFAKKAHRIVTVSEYSKQDISKSYGVESSKIDVVYNGANEIYTPVKTDVKKQIEENISNGKPYFIFVGALHPRKNVSGLLKAFDKYKSDTQSNIKLIIVGEKMFKNSELSNVFAKMTFKKDVVFVGRLSAVQLKKVIAGALALIFVPFFEGFGIPLVEAMKCDVPILASNVTSIPEVCGNAAIYANPYDINSIAEGMKKLVADERLRTNLIKQGRIQSSKFSWDKTAEKLWQSIEACLNDLK